MSELELRPVTTDDFADVLALHQRAQTFDSVDQILQMEELKEELDDEQVVLATDTRLCLIDDKTVGYIHTVYMPSEEREERCYLFGQVDPDYRRRGVGTALMTWGLERAETQLRSSGRSLPCFIRVENYDFIDGAQRLFDHLDMTPVRYSDEMLRPLTDIADNPTSQDQTLGGGTKIVPWPLDRNDEILQARNAAFADHWGSTPIASQRWEHMTTGFGARADLSFIAVNEDNAVVAHCLNHRYEADDEIIGRSDGWIMDLGTIASVRGQGIATSLIGHSLRAFADAGLTHASIGVDSESPTGANRLYRNLGFEPNMRMITRQIQLD